MIRRGARFFILAALFILTVHFLFVGTGPLPGIGPLFSFQDGLFANARFSTEPKVTYSFKGLSSPVHVFVDKNKVPHIVAQNEEDLFFGQGFVMAANRLWQMDMTTRAGGAELSEVLGGKTQGIDRFFIQMGLKSAVDQSFAMIQEDPHSYRILQAFTRGVNAYIESLEYHDWPVEYKIVQFRPQAFTEKRVIQLLKVMSFSLAARSYDLPFTEIVNHLGWKRSVDLFPDFFGEDLPFLKFDAFFHGQNDPASNAGSQNYKAFRTKFKSFPDFLLPFQTDGSNSWVISKKSALNKANILANDTHLGLKAPPVWFENRLLIPGHLDVYGASFPGAPTVVLGMNRHLSWGATNGTIDVLDWFEIEFKNENSDEYLVDGKWKKADVSTAQFKVRKAPPEQVKVVWTDFGPIVHREGKLGLAVRWSGHEPSNELSVFYKMNFASSVNEARALLRDYKTPIQNFSLADQNEIGIITAGIYPKKPFGFGRVVENGRSSKNNWGEFVQAQDKLVSLNPKEGVLGSANQRPRGSNFDSYLGWDFEEPFRGSRIHQKIQGRSDLRVEEVMKMQNEAFNQLAFYFFQIVDREMMREILPDSEKRHFELLRTWDFQDDEDLLSTSLFYSWIESLENRLWKTKLAFQKKKFFPKRARLLIEVHRLKQEDFKKFTNLLLASWKEIDFEKGLKKWGQVQPTVFKHVTSFPGLNGASVPVQGSKYSLNSNKGSHGGAWRFIAEMSDPPKAWSRIPGGQNGNPLSADYFDQIAEWQTGKMKAVFFDPPEKWRGEQLSEMELIPQ